MTRKITVFKKGVSLSIAKPSLRALIALLDSHYKPANRGTLSIIFISHEKLAQMHGEFCGDPAPTDIITFPAPAEDTESFGELYISPQAARDYTKKHGGKFEDELRRYVIHGYLHLLGYDDLQPALKRKMRAQEKKSLALAKGIRKTFSPAG